MSKTTKYWIIGVVIVLVLAALAWLSLQPANPFPVDPADHLSSWTIPINIDATSTAILLAHIATLKGELGTTTGSVSDLDVDIANTYASIGQGENAYQYYEKALTASSSETVAYADLGALFAELHATSTALKAYAMAVTIAPSTEFYQLSYLNYLAAVEPESTTTAAAFVAAGEQLGSTTPDYLITRATWLAAIGSTTAAIADWELVRAQVSPEQQGAIDAQIARLRQ